MQSVLRVCAAVRDFSSREGQPFHARFLLQGVAQYAFRSPSKSMRHFYVKDILQFLKTGDCADRLYSCKALQEIVSDKGLGRFQDAVVYNLMLVAKNRVVVNYPVHPEVRGEAIEALRCILPSDAARKYPYLYRLRRLQTADDLGVQVASLISRLDDANVKFTDQPDSLSDDEMAEMATATAPLVMCELLPPFEHFTEGLSILSSWLASTFSEAFAYGREDNSLQ